MHLDNTAGIKKEFAGETDYAADKADNDAGINRELVDEAENVVDNAVRKGGEAADESADSAGISKDGVVEAVDSAGISNGAIDEKTYAASGEGKGKGDASGADPRKSGLTEDAPLPEEQANADAVLSRTEGIDVDLTSLSSTMVYSEVFNMMYEPEDYIGKTIRMEGIFSAYHDKNTGNDYYSCIIQDATACRAQGMEFVLADEKAYPEQGGVFSFRQLA